jgi:adenylate kinase family enzyme
MTKPYTFIFVGRSGCGKGTQLKLLRDYVSNNFPNEGQFAFSTGDAFRELFTKDTYSSNLAKDITSRGALQPLFLTISMWGNAFLNTLKKDDHVFIDGYPRVEAEAVAMSSMLSFFNRATPVILDFQVSRETSAERMRIRAREDDIPENIETRLDWYERDVVPAVTYLKNQPGYVYIVLDGEKSIEEIHTSVITQFNENLK